jgi:hypothetical protein
MFDFRRQLHPRITCTQARLDTPSGVSYYIDFDTEMRKGVSVIYSHMAYDGLMRCNSMVIQEGVKVKVFNVGC